MTTALPAPGLTRPAPPFSERWRALPRWGRVLLALAGVAVVVQIAASIVGGVTGSGNQVSGSGSSYATTGTGTAAYAQLLATRGQSVSRLAAPLTPANLDATTTLFVLDPTTWSPASTATVARQLSVGRVVVVSGRVADRAVLAHAGLAHAVTWSPDPVGAARAVGTTGFVLGVHTLNSPGGGSLRVTGTLPASVAVLAVGQFGDVAIAIHATGWVVVMASSSPLQNQALATDDNAAFGLNLARPRAVGVTFDEYVHGFGSGATGLAGLPAPWRFGLGAVLLALGVWLLSASRRLGPPQHADRDLVPPRINYVDAVATLLSTKVFAQMDRAVSPVATALRTTLVARLGLDPDASDDDLRAAADHGAVSDHDYTRAVAVATTPPRTSGDVVALGHALATTRRDTVDPKENHD